MKGLLSLDLSIIFTLIFLYIFSRILINAKHDNMGVVKELFLVGFVASILMILTIDTMNLFGKVLLFVPLGFFAFYCFEGSTKDTLIMCLSFIVLMQIALFAIFKNQFDIKNCLLNIIGGLIGIFVSNNLIKKAQLRFY